MGRIRVKRGLFQNLPNTGMLQGEIMGTLDRGTFHLATSQTTSLPVVPAIDALQEATNIEPSSDYVLLHDSSETNGQKEKKVLIADLFDELILPQGPIGPQGPQGEQGPIGLTGPQGPVGPIGPKGDNGDVGPQGIQGVQGPQGPAGVNGTNGSDGASAYQIAVNQGFVGTQTQWLESLVGSTGTQGPQGPIGLTGPQGPQGIQGITGPAGATGSQGPQGPIGIGIPTGGTTGQVLAKNSAADYDTSWIALAGGDTVDLPYEEVPTPPATDTVRLFGRRIAGRMLPAYIGPSGLDSALQPWLARNKLGLFIPPGNGNQVQVLGMNVSGTGSTTSANVNTNNIQGAMRRLEYAVTTASATAVAGARSTANQYHIGNTSTPFGGFTFVARFGPSRGVASNATRRFFAGMTSSTGAPTDVDPSAGTTWANMIGVGADAADANFHIMHRTGTGAVTKINTGIPKAYADNTEMFELALFTAPTGTPSVGYRFTRLSDGEFFIGTITTALPAATTLLTWQLWTSVGGTSSVIGLAVASVYIETDF